jgi:hypothetical protein
VGMGNDLTCVVFLMYDYGTFTLPSYTDKSIKRRKFSKLPQRSQGELGFVRRSRVGPRYITIGQKAITFMHRLPTLATVCLLGNLESSALQLNQDSIASILRISGEAISYSRVSHYLSYVFLLVYREYFFFDSKGWAHLGIGTRNQTEPSFLISHRP